MEEVSEITRLVGYRERGITPGQAQEPVNLICQGGRFLVALVWKGQFQAIPVTCCSHSEGITSAGVHQTKLRGDVISMSHTIFSQGCRSYFKYCFKWTLQTSEYYICCKMSVHRSLFLNIQDQVSQLSSIHFDL